MSNPVILTVAPSIPPYYAEKRPDLDLSPAGIAAEVVRAHSAGASVVHMHVWDETGQPTTDLTAFQQTVALIREECDIIVEGSTGGINTLTPAERSVSLQADVEMASLNPGSVNYDQGVYVNSPDDIHYWATEMKKRGIKPDVAIFEAGMINNTMALVDAGLIEPPPLFGFVMGLQGAIPATPKNLLFLTEILPPGAPWGLVNHGTPDVALSAMAMAMGGHARGGFEDTREYTPGQPATSNAQFIERLARIAHEIGREVASPTQARQMLGLPPRG